MKRFLEGRTIVAVVGTILVCAAATAGAATLINGSDVKNGSLTGKDVKNASLTAKDVKQGTLTSGDVKNSTLQGADIKDASIAGADLSAGAKASVFSGPNWGIADRNVLGNGDCAGPRTCEPAPSSSVLKTSRRRNPRTESAVSGSGLVRRRTRQRSATRSTSSACRWPTSTS